MRKVKFSVLIFAFVLLLLVGCNKAVDPKEAFDENLKYYYGTLENNKFTNEFMNMTMDIPKDWHVLEDQMKQQIQKTAYEMLEKDEKAIENIKLDEVNVYNALFLFKNPIAVQNEFNPSLLAIVERLVDSNVKTEEAYLKVSQERMASNELPMGFEYEFKNDFSKEKMGNVDFTVMEVVLKTSVLDITQKYYAYKVDDKMISFVISFSTPEEEIELLKILETIKFIQ